MYIIFKGNKYYTKWFADRIKYFNLESSAVISVKGMYGSGIHTYILISFQT